MNFVASNILIFRSILVKEVVKILDRSEVNKKMIINAVYQRGFDLEKRYYGCAQSVVAALQDIFPINAVLVKAATSFTGGFASTIEGPCGPLSAGIMVLSYFFGRSYEEYANITLLRRPGPLVRAYWEKFEEHYQGDTCRTVQTHLFGKAYKFLDAEEYLAYEEAGGHSKKCADVVGQSAAWLAEILIDNKVPCRTDIISSGK